VIRLYAQAVTLALPHGGTGGGEYVPQLGFGTLDGPMTPSLICSALRTAQIVICSPLKSQIRNGDRRLCDETHAVRVTEYGRTTE